MNRTPHPVSAEIHTAQVQRVDLMIAMFERDTVKDHGYRSPAHWLAAATNLEIGECHRIESLAKLLRLEPEVRDAYASGLLDADKARQIAYFCQHYPRTMNPCDFEKARTILIDHARKTVATKATVRALIRRLEHLYSTGDGPPPGEDTTRNELFVSTTLHGRVVIKETSTPSPEHASGTCSHHCRHRGPKRTASQTTGLPSDAPPTPSSNSCSASKPPDSPPSKAV
ncbi:uncharacterized protein DUF222 [Rhodococcus sp. SMB37]|nr:uncharacterized protein DUF222 [Rhodococcus sp. SMB37]